MLEGFLVESGRYAMVWAVDCPRAFDLQGVSRNAVKDALQGRLPSLFVKAGGMKNDECDCLIVVPVRFEFW